MQKSLIEACCDCKSTVRVKPLLGILKVETINGEGYCTLDDLHSPALLYLVNAFSTAVDFIYVSGTVVCLRHIDMRMDVE